MPKRPRQPMSSDDGRPNPPPPPPASLVKLLKKEEKVLEYFTALQANLEYDVKKWKRRAREYQEESRNLKEQVDESEKKPPRLTNSQTNKTTLKEKPSNDSGDQIPGQESQSKSPTEGIPVEDAMFNFESSSDEEKNENDGNKGATRSNFTGLAINGDMLESDDEASSPPPKNTTKRQSDYSALPDGNITKYFSRAESNTGYYDEKFALRQLVEADECLHRLGIKLVDEHQVEVEVMVDEPATKLAAVEGTLEKETLPKNEKATYRRRSDESVVADFMRLFKSLTKIKITKDKYYPFMTSDLIPCYMGFDSSKVPHPAVEGKRCSLRVLTLMDAYSQVLGGRDSFQDDTLDPSLAGRLLVGMKDRHTMVAKLLSSVHGEVAVMWAVHDRSTRLSTTALHYRPMPGDETRENKSNEENIVGIGAKSHMRLAALVERCLLVHIITSIYLTRDDPQTALQLLWNYVVSTAPSLAYEEYPKLAPVLSLCVLEAILTASGGALGGTSGSAWIDSILDKRSSISRVLSLVIHATALVYQTRMESVDDRITDIARVELAAYNRLLKSARSWLHSSEKLTSLNDIRMASMTVFDESKDYKGSHSGGGLYLPSNIVHLAMIIYADMVGIDQAFAGALSTLKAASEDTDSTDLEQCRSIFLGCCMAKRQLEIRRMDNYRQIVNSPLTATVGSPPVHYASQLVDYIAAQDSSKARMAVMEVVSSAFLCCLELGDGESAMRLMQWIINHDCLLSSSRMEIISNKEMAAVLQTVFASIHRVSSTPTVRVINLERRKDRLAAFAAQMVQESVMMIKAVARFDINSSQDEDDFDGYLYGCHAFDGQGRLAEAEQRLSSMVGDTNLDELVATHWRPNDLKPFDKDAPASEDLVRISPSEKACALSHIGAWRGVLHSLSRQNQDASGGHRARETSKYHIQRFTRSDSMIFSHCHVLVL
jgi:hypothetical protein